MFNNFNFIVAVVSGIGFGIVYNIFVIKDYPDYKRKSAYFNTIVIFLFFSLLTYVLISVKSYANSTINNYSAKMEQYVKDNYPDNDFVKNGLDLKGINNNLTQINSTVSELKTLLPSDKELGIDKMLYDLIVDYAIKGLQKRLNVVNYSAKAVNNFADENGFLTISSMTYNLKTNAIKFVNTVVLIIIAVFGLVVLIYIVSSLRVARREKKNKNI